MKWDNIPKTLTNRDQWVLWKLVTRDGKPTKIPFQINGQPAKSNDSATWTSFQAVKGHYENNSTEYSGIGFVLDEQDSIVGFDFDDCISEDGELHETIVELITKINSYTEISPSGRGIRIITMGSLPVAVKKIRNDIPGAKQIEVYEKGRYLTITGQALYGKPVPINSISDNVWDYYQKLGTQNLAKSTSSPTSIHLTDKDEWIIDRLLTDEKTGAEFRRLYALGDLSSFDNNQSRGDLKLVGLISYYAGFDEQQIDRIFRSSKLYRDKWDKSHRADGATYGEMTIEKVLGGRFIRHKRETEPFLQFHYSFRYNEVLGRVEFCPRGEDKWELIDRRNFSSILRHIKNSNGTCGEQYLHVILDSDFCTPFNPFVDYFESLPTVTGTSELQKLMDTVVTSDKDYWEWTFTRWMIATVACALDEHTSNHTVTVFQGDQGIGKTTWLQRLIPNVLRDYTYPGELNPSDKDTMVYLSECLLINLDELASLNRGKESALKEVITKNEIRVRKVYRRNPESLIRRASFTGSVNDSQILTDTTGSRRFLIHEVESINYTTPIDMDKVWAEVYGLYKANTKYWFDGSDIERINLNNNKFVQVTALEEILLRNFKPVMPGEPVVNKGYKWTATELMNNMIERKLIPKAASVSYLGKLLQKHGFSSKSHSNLKVYDIGMITDYVKYFELKES